MLSIIIPVLNEADCIEQLLEHLKDNATSGNDKEILVVDGGSTDATVEIVNRFKKRYSGMTIRLLESGKGRARQMNLGAKEASGSILYFLHADTLPPKGFDVEIISAVLDGMVAGCFKMKFDKAHPMLRFSQWFTRLNLRVCRGGDQSLFIKKEIFDQLGGYDESFTIYEDNEFIGRIYDNHKFTVLDNYVITSARRYDKNGTLRLQYHFTVIHLKKWIGASPAELSRYYHRHIVT